MKEELIFVENQRFRKWPVIVLLLLSNVFFIYVCIIQIGLKKPFGDQSMSDAILVGITVLILIISLFPFFLRLVTVIDKDGVYVQMFPFQLKHKFTPWEFITEAEVSKITPSNQLNNWGMRFKSVNFSLINFAGSGIHWGIKSTTYTLSGNNALKLVLKNNRILYIGTRKPEELSEFLSKIDAERKQK